MTQFEVHYESFEIIEAENLREANKIMEERNSLVTTTNFYDCKESKDHEVIGHCEVSGLSIFEGDEYLHDKEGVMWLKEFDK